MLIGKLLETIKKDKTKKTLNMENKLTSMVDFVLEQDKLILKLSPSRSGATQFNEFNVLKTDRIINYANFLKQPLTLNMFVPCDEEGNIIPETRFTGLADWDKNKDIHEKNYQQAKEKVLFEGIEISFNETDNAQHPTAMIIESKKSLICTKYKGVRFFNNFKTIEDLIKLDLTLTASALKQIGINQ